MNWLIMVENKRKTYLISVEYQKSKQIENQMNNKYGKYMTLDVKDDYIDIKTEEITLFRKLIKTRKKISRKK